MTLEQKLDTCLSYRHDFGIVSDEERSQILAELNMWLHAMERCGLVVKDRRRVEEMELKLMRQAINDNRGVTKYE